jgi:DNA polymerase III epsilon subunit-like protein
VETFNLNLSFRFNRPWQVSILNFQGNNTSEKDIRIDWSKVAPNLKIGFEAARITHFNQEEHKRIAIQPKEAFSIFWNDLKNCDYIMGHNILRFDIYLLKGYAEFMGVPWKWILPKIIDTKAIAQGIKMGVPYNSKQGSFIDYQYRYSNAVVKGIKTSLSTLAKEFGIDLDESKLHNATYDLEINKAVWDKLKFQIEL